MVYELGFGVLLLKAFCLILRVFFFFFLGDFSLCKENPDIYPVLQNQTLAGSEVGLW